MNYKIIKKKKKYTIILNKIIMFEEAAIARKDSLATPTKSEHIHGSERRDSLSPLVGFVV